MSRQAEQALVLELGIWFGNAVKNVDMARAARALAIASHGAARVVGPAIGEGTRTEIAFLLRQAADAWEPI
jgi:hypothetical protein